ncbi:MULTISPECIES: hypothetical protein [Microcystis]|jgi:hypothetical protein|uniref:Similarity n=13 Tax=Microcystis TaxID=1125 RepID=I4IXM3_MICAE|nr:hypothetical protein VL20_2260 [Microcystis panniformis FACHB-1757]ARI82766.1 hypothetical protein BH695_3487 [Microcystis aeruginosa PCC 7806SL]NCQ70542.1 hypothetical protein [Microcystis aeruginosa W13-16]NCQ75081.1 hypothetical protein [Microcystis aeruginosa W13-13]NCQ79529.1 hypothetical protein [Microcystis aeruginosa W13-15]NCQ83787.1 hypothetical protein [Microcystis aeruginosa W13-18]NCQ91785.1 hypothetical protein [Microcystis aeruginosa LG13-13]NCR03186.1 hypothetical protein 
MIMNPPNNPTRTEEIPTIEELPTIAELQAKFAQLQADPEFRKKPFWQRIAEIGALVPQSEWRKHLPTDFARNFEHYMYGAPREDEEE